MSTIRTYFESKDTINWEELYKDMVLQFGEYSKDQHEYNQTVRLGQGQNMLPKQEYGNFKVVKTYCPDYHHRSTEQHIAYELTNHNIAEDFDRNTLKADGASFRYIRNDQLIPVLEDLSKGIVVFRHANLDANYYTTDRAYITKTFNSGYYSKNDMYCFNMIDGTIHKIGIANDRTTNAKVFSYAENITNNYEKYLGEGELSSQAIYYVDFLERLYDIPKGKLDNTMPFTTYFKLLRYTGNLFQSLLNFSTESTWFIQNLGDTMTTFGQQLQEKNLQSWFKMNLPDFRYLISQPDSDMFMHFMIARKHKDISLVEFQKIEKNITSLNNKWLKEFDRTLYKDSKSKDDRVYLKGERGRNIMTSQTLPQFMIRYVNNRVFKTTPLYKYVKYIVDEGVKAYKDGHKLSLMDIEHYLYDYNNMLQEINPKAKFVLPYKVKNAHDTMATNYNIIMRERKSEDRTGRKSYEEVYGIALDECYKTDKYLITHPRKDGDLAMEGATLNHCVGSYANRVLNGDCMIFFMRRANRPQEPFVTIEVIKNGDNFKINQIKGKYNKDYYSYYRDQNREDEDVKEVRGFVETWLGAYKENMLKLAEEKRVKRQIEQYASQNYALPLVQYLHLQGYTQFYFDKTQSPQQNYKNTITSALVHIIHTKKNSEMWNDEYLGIMRSDLKKILKELNIRHKDVITFEDEQYIDWASFEYNTDDIVSIAELMKKEPALIGVATKEVQKQIIKNIGNEIVVPEIAENQIAMEL